MTHPFKPGTRVAINNERYGRCDPDYSEAFVEKVYKNGNFTLRGSPQQWKPWGRDGSAHETGNHFSSRRLIIWNESTDAEISAAIAKRARERRFYELRKQIEGIKREQITVELCDGLQMALESAQ